MGDPHGTTVAQSAVPTTIAEHLSSRGVAPELQALVASVSEQRSLVSRVRGHVALSPGGGGYIVAHVHPQVLSLAMPPPRARKVASEHGWTVEADSGITSYLRIPAGALRVERKRARVLDLFVQSVDWRAGGPHPLVAATADGDADAPQPRQIEQCPVHFTAMPGGHCDSCDD